MHRLFVGIDPPFEVKDTLMEIMGGVIGARWQSEDQLHITLRFLGERTAQQANDIAECLSYVSARPLAVGLEGMGQFDRKGRIDTLWIGVRPADGIRHLHRKVSRQLEGLGIRPDTRAYLPHLTIARFSRGAGSFDDFMRRHGGLRIPPFSVTEFCLYESHLTQEGAVYSVVERYQFAQGSLFSWEDPPEFAPPRSAEEWVA
ncbi:MAG: RNA 2',3'-cyclic phosphodiesterase [Pacificimonas sp.]|nr:RNA 2',3'-cyclic phosphodiesterase [Pacificimonas sp.]